MLLRAELMLYSWIPRCTTQGFFWKLPFLKVSFIEIENIPTCLFLSPKQNLFIVKKKNWNIKYVPWGGKKERKTPTHLLAITTISTQYLSSLHIFVCEYTYCNVHGFVTCILSLLYGDHLSTSLKIHSLTTALSDTTRSDTSSNKDCPSTRNWSWNTGKTVEHSAKNRCPSTSKHSKKGLMDRHKMSRDPGNAPASYEAENKSEWPRIPRVTWGHHTWQKSARAGVIVKRAARCWGVNLLSEVDLLFFRWSLASLVGLRLWAISLTLPSAQVEVREKECTALCKSEAYTDYKVFPKKRRLLIQRRCQPSTTPS